MKHTLLLALMLAVLVAACGPQPEPRQVIDPISGPDQNAQEQSQWSAGELTDVMRAEQFRVDELQPVFVAPFATWCAACTQQLEALEAADVAYVGVAIDEENASAVRAYVQARSFSGRFAVADTAYVDALVAEFGASVTNLNNVPTILVCNDEAYALEAGVKPPGLLVERAQNLC